MESTRTIKTVLTVLRALILCALLSLASHLSHAFVLDVLANPLAEGLAHDRPLALYSALFYGVFLFGYARLFALYHAAFREECPLCQGKINGLFSQVRALFHTPTLRVYFITLFLALAVFPVFSAYPYLAYALFGDTVTYGQTILIASLTWPLEMLLVLLAHGFAARKIRSESRADAERRGEKANRHLVWEVCKASFNLIAASVLIPLVILMASTFVIFLVFFPALIVAILAFHVIRFLRAWQIRRRFMKGLKKTCERGHHRLEKLKRPYLSLLFPNEGENFLLTSGGKTYSCKLVYSVRRNVPMFFHKGGYGTFVKTISVFRMEVAHHVKVFRYGFESKYPKIIIVCPVPKKILARRDSALTEVDVAATESKFIYMGIGPKGTKTNVYETSPIEGGLSRELDTGEHFDGYQFYNASGFLNAIERGVLDR